MNKKEIIREYLSTIGRKGGEQRAKKHDTETLREWARKGGRPRKETKRCDAPR
jgi:general stress protein YciG